MKVSDAGFDAAVAGEVALVDFWAPWCGPCRMQGPIVDEVAQTVAGRANVLKVNVDESPAVASRFSIRAIPTLVLLKDGREVRRFVGMQSKVALVAAIESQL
jgi:thioredoxin 1